MNVVSREWRERERERERETERERENIILSPFITYSNFHCPCCVFVIKNLITVLFWTHTFINTDTILGEQCMCLRFTGICYCWVQFQFLSLLLGPLLDLARYFLKIVAWFCHLCLYKSSVSFVQILYLVVSACPLVSFC